MPFSTFDVDNDNRDGNFEESSCARLYKVLIYKALQLCVKLFKRSLVTVLKCCYIFLHLSSQNFIENDHNFVFFGFKVSTQQHFKSRLF